MDKKLKSVTLEEIYDFCDEHFETKDEKSYTFINSLDSIESCKVGFFEGVISAILWAGIQVTNLDDFYNSNDKQEHKIKKFSQLK